MDAVGGACQGMGRPSGSALATSCSWKKSGIYFIGRGADGAWSRFSHLLVLIQKMTSGQAISQDVL